MSAEHLDHLIEAAVALRPAQETHAFHQNLPGRRLLAEERPIAAVAHETGYGSAPAFIAGFKRHFGVTPHQYRRR